MTKVLILGANGQLARHTFPWFLQNAEVELTLYLRRAGRLTNPDTTRARIVEGDVLSEARLMSVMQGQDVVYANLAGNMAPQAAAIVAAMKSAGVKRLIFISSMGIYGEVPGERYRSVLDPYRDAAAIVEASDLDWTVLRPGWFTRDSELKYRLTRKGTPFIGHDVSLDSLASLIVKLSLTPGWQIRESLGVSNA